MTDQTQKTSPTAAAVAEAPIPDKGTVPTPTPPASPAGGPPPAGPKTAAKKRKAKKRVKRIIAIVVTLALLAGISWAIWFFIFRETVEQGDIMFQPVQLNSIQSKVEGSGNARAGESAAITLSASGTVQEVYVSVGDAVNEGDPLYTIVSPAAQLALTEAQKGVRTAEDGVEQAKENVITAQEGVVTARDAVTEAQEGVTAARERVKEAEDGVKEAEDGVTEAQNAVAEAQNGVKEAQNAVVEAQNGVKEAQNAVADAQKELANRQKELQELQASADGLTLTAPFAGKLISVEEIGIGSELSEGAAVATLADNKTMKVALYFSYAYENSIYVGQSADVSVPSMMLTCKGTVSAVNKISKVSPEGAILFEVIIEVLNPGALDEGMNATASMVGVDGGQIFPYDEGELTYGRTEKLTAKLAGTVLSKDLMQYTDVSAGQVLLVQGQDKLDEQLAAKQKEVDAAQKGVTDAEKGVTTAEKGVEQAQKGVSSAEKGVTTAQKGVTTAQKGVEQAKKAVTDAQKGVTTAQKAVTDAQKGVTTAERNVVKAQEAVGDAEQAVVDAQEKVAEAEKALEDLNAVSPINGTITSCVINPGEEVKGGDTVITISDTTKMVVEIQVDDRNIGFVTPGMMVELSDWGENTWMGTVTKIDMNPSQDNMGSGVTNYPVTLTVDNFDGSLIAGMWLQYSFVASQSDNCLVVPNQAVKSATDGEGNEITVVFLQAEERPENAVTMPEQSPGMPKTFPTEEDGYYAVPVTAGLSDAYNVEIKSGLNEGDVVFVNYLSASGDSWGSGGGVMIG